MNITNATPQANLPLRQAFRQPICAPEPKIHDITEKFLKASDGMLYPWVEAMFKCAVREGCGVGRLTWLLYTFSVLSTHDRTTQN